MEFKNPYFLTVERINLLQRWILVHSYLYYEKNESIVKDVNYDANTRQLIYLKNKYPNEFKQSDYYQYFKDFDSGTGFDLYSKIKENNDFELLKKIENNAKLLLKLVL